MSSWRSPGSRHLMNPLPSFPEAPFPSAASFASPPLANLLQRMEVVDSIRAITGRRSTSYVLSKSRETRPLCTRASFHVMLNCLPVRSPRRRGMEEHTHRVAYTRVEPLPTRRGMHVGRICQLRQRCLRSSYANMLYAATILTSSDEDTTFVQLVDHPHLRP